MNKSLFEHFFLGNDLSIKQLYEEIAQDPTIAGVPTATPSPEPLDANESVQDLIPLGSIYYGEWGWEQTNVEFFEVVGFAGKQTVLLKKLQSKVVPAGNQQMSGMAYPIKGKYKDNNTYKARINKVAWNKSGLPPLKISKNLQAGVPTNLHLREYQGNEGIFTSWYA